MSLAADPVTLTSHSSFRPNAIEHKRSPGLPNTQTILLVPILVVALLVLSCATPEDRAAEHVAAAAQFYASGDFQNARAAAQIAIQVAPKNVPARYLLALLAERNGDIGQMLGHLEVVIGEDHMHVPSRVKMATVLMDAQDYAGAEALAADARHLAPDDPEVRLLGARLLLRSGNSAAAVEELDAVLAGQPKNVDAALLRGVTIAQSNPEQGLAVLARAADQLGGQSAVPLRNARIDILRGLGRNAAADQALRALAREAPPAGEGETPPAVGASDTRNARLAFDGVLQNQPDDVPALVGRGALNLHDGRLEDALADLRGAVRKEPGHRRALALLAEAQLRSGNRTLAEDAWRRLLEAQPMETRASLGLAELLVAQQRPGEAEILYKQVLVRQPDNATALGGLVDALLARREWAAAGAAARTAQAVTTLPGFGAEQTGKVLLAERNFAGAQRAFERALREAPTSDRALDGLTTALAATGKVTEAGDYLRKHLRAHPDSQTARVLLATTLFRQQLPGEARPLLDAVLAENPRQVPAWLALAEGLPEQRSAILELALASNPANERLELRLGASYEQAGRSADAVRVYEQALARDAHAALPANALAMLLLEARTDAASYQRALELTWRFADSYNPELLHTLGWAHYRTGNARAAVQFLEQAQEQAMTSGADDAILRYHLGMAYLAADDRLSARKQLELSLKLASEFPGAAEARAALGRLGV